MSSTGAAPYPHIDAALDALPGSLVCRSGSIFYTGRSAFSAPSELYILGLNPGGDPTFQAAETIGADRLKFREGPPSWSAYADASWRGAAPGKWGMQPRVLHLLAALKLEPRAVPASNVVFVRSPTEATLQGEKDELMRACWPVHLAVIETLTVRVVLCFGGTAARWVRDELAAHKRVDFYQEANERRWMNEAHRAADGRIVITLTHPGRANLSTPVGFQANGAA